MDFKNFTNPKRTRYEHEGKFNEGLTNANFFHNFTKEKFYDENKYLKIRVNYEVYADCVGPDERGEFLIIQCYDLLDICKYKFNLFEFLLYLV